MRITKIELQETPEVIIPAKQDVIITDDVGEKYRVTAYEKITTTPPPTVKKVGIAVTGLEFTPTKLPGVENTDYSANSLSEYKRLATLGFKTFRVPFLGKRMDDAYLALIKKNIDYAKAVGGTVWLDFHDYGGHRDTASRVKVANAFKADPTVACIEIDNEPHDGNVPLITYYTWVKEVVAAMRTAGWTKLIGIPVFSWSNMDYFDASWVPPIKDDKVVYVFHNYFNKANTGFQHPALPDELATKHVEHLNAVNAWATKHGVKIAVTEFGVPAKQEWIDNIKPFVAKLKETVEHIFYWGAGEWYTSETVYKDIHKQVAP